MPRKKKRKDIDESFGDFLENMWDEQDRQIDDLPILDYDDVHYRGHDPFLDDSWSWDGDMLGASTWEDLGDFIEGDWRSFTDNVSDKNITVLRNVSDFGQSIFTETVDDKIEPGQKNKIDKLAKVAELSMLQVLKKDLFHLIFKSYAPPKPYQDIHENIDHPVLKSQLLSNLNIINLLYRSDKFGDLRKDTTLNILSSATVMPDLLEGVLSLYIRVMNKDGFDGGEQTPTQKDLFVEATSNGWGKAIVTAIVNSGIRKLIEKLRVKLTGLEESLNSWGISMSDLGGMDSSQQLMLFHIFNSSFHREIDSAARKFLGSAHSKIKTMVKTKVTKNTVVRGRDLTNMMLRDRMMIAINKKLFLYNVAEGKVLSLMGYKTKNKGPVIICIDDSGSMSPPAGAPAKWARTVFIALAQNLIRSDRSLYACLFSGNVPSETRCAILNTDKRSKRIEKAFGFIDMHLGGGTNFHMPLKWAFDIIDKDAPKADIIFITDGQCSIEPDRLKALKKKKIECDSSFYLVMITDRFEHARGSNIISMADKTYHIQSTQGYGMDNIIEDVSATADIIKRTM